MDIISKSDLSEGNRLIEQFMCESDIFEEPHYDDSWDKLMSVIEKIESIGEGNNESVENYHFILSKRYTRVIYNWDYYLSENKNPPFNDCYKDYRIALFFDSKILATWQAVVDFITWYNSKQNTNITNS